MLSHLRLRENGYHIFATIRYESRHVLEHFYFLLIHLELTSRECYSPPPIKDVHLREFPGGTVGSGPGVITAVARIWPLAQEFLHEADITKTKTKTKKPTQHILGKTSNNYLPSLFLFFTTQTSHMNIPTTNITIKYLGIHSVHCFQNAPSNVISFHSGGQSGHVFNPFIFRQGNGGSEKGRMATTSHSAHANYTFLSRHLLWLSW